MGEGRRGGERQGGAQRKMYSSLKSTVKRSSEDH